MIQEIPILPVARQSLSVTIDGVRWAIRLFETTNNIMACDFILGDVPLISGVRARSGTSPLLPYRYMWKTNGGNFFFTTAKDNTEYPWWENFGVTCRLFHVSADQAVNYGV